MQELNSLSYLLPSANETMCTRIPMFLTRFCRFELKASSQTKLIKRATALLKNYLDDASCPSLKNDNAQGTTTPKALQHPRKRSEGWNQNRHTKKTCVKHRSDRFNPTARLCWYRGAFFEKSKGPYSLSKMRLTRFEKQNSRHQNGNFQPNRF